MNVIKENFWDRTEDLSRHTEAKNKPENQHTPVPESSSSSEYCMMQKELNPHSPELTASASLNPETEDMELIIMDNQDSVHIM